MKYIFALVYNIPLMFIIYVWFSGNPDFDITWIKVLFSCLMAFIGNEFIGADFITYEETTADNEE